LAVQYLNGQSFIKAYVSGDGNVGINVFEIDDGYLVIGSGYADEYNGWQALKILKWTEVVILNGKSNTEKLNINIWLGMLGVRSNCLMVILFLQHQLVIP